jgi:FtsP/CotA-like multicopper oxidase with cupredoxin domain
MALNKRAFLSSAAKAAALPALAAQCMIVEQGKRYRMLFRNATSDQHPTHLHRDSFEITQIGDKKMSGLIKDTMNVMALQTVSVDFFTDNPGDSLLHCHRQLHMDDGFMQMVKYKA